jgi:hypothetical protein
VIVLLLTQDRCIVCTELTIGSEIDLDAIDGTPQVEGCFGLFADSVSVSARQMHGCAKSTLGSEIIWDAPDGTPR